MCLLLIGIFTARRNICEQNSKFQSFQYHETIWENSWILTKTKKLKCDFKPTIISRKGLKHYNCCPGFKSYSKRFDNYCILPRNRPQLGIFTCRLFNIHGHSFYRNRYELSYWSLTTQTYCNAAGRPGAGVGLCFSWLYLCCAALISSNQNTAVG